MNRLSVFCTVAFFCGVLRDTNVKLLYINVIRNVHVWIAWQLRGLLFCCNSDILYFTSDWWISYCIFYGILKRSHIANWALKTNMDWYNYAVELQSTCLIVNCLYIIIFSLSSWTQGFFRHYYFRLLKRECYSFMHARLCVIR